MPEMNIKTPFYAAVGAGEAVLDAASSAFGRLRQRASQAQSGAQERLEGARFRINGLPGELSEQLEISLKQLQDAVEGLQGDLRQNAQAVVGELGDTLDKLRARLPEPPEELRDITSARNINELRDSLSPEQLRKIADGYISAASDIYFSLADRGEAAAERIRTSPTVVDGRGKAESVLGDAAHATGDALETLAAQTRSVGEKALRLAGKASQRLESGADGLAGDVAEGGSGAAADVVTAAEKVSKVAAAAADALTDAGAKLAEKAPAKRARPKKSPAAKPEEKKTERDSD
jgi:heparin binding hemagglutinin HbhA